MQISRSFWAYLFVGAVILPISTVLGLLFCVNWKIALILVGLILLLLFNNLYPHMALLPVFFVIPLDRLARIGPDSSITLAKILIAITVISWVIRTLLLRDGEPIFRLRHNLLFFLSLLFLFFSFVSIVNSHHEEVFLGQMVRRVSLVVFLCLIINYLHNKKSMLRALKALLLGYVLIGFIGLYEIHSGESILKTFWGDEDTELEFTMTSGASRIAGSSGDPDFHAIAIVFPSLIAGFFLFRTRSLILKTLLVLFLVLMLINMAGTGSRGGMIALFLGLMILWLLSNVKYKYTLAFLTPLVFLVLILALQAISPVMPTERYTGGGTQSIMYRVGWMQMAFSMIKDHPFIGIGVGNVPGNYNRYINVSPAVPRQPHWTHNTYLQVWAEAGVFCFLVYGLIYLVCARNLWSVIRSENDFDIRTLGILLLSVLVAYAFFAGTSNVAENENYWIVFALSSATYQLSKTTNEREKSGSERFGA
jgi:putative inorganic carbon (hco3(-)) transporter